MQRMQAQVKSWKGLEGSPLDALVGRRNGSKRVQSQLQVKGAAAQVVHNADRVTPRRQVQRSRPSTIAIPACISQFLSQSETSFYTCWAAVWFPLRSQQPTQLACMQQIRNTMLWCMSTCPGGSTFAEGTAGQIQRLADKCQVQSLGGTSLYEGSPMIMTLRPDPLVSKVGGAEGLSVARTALVGPEGPLISRARLGRRLLLGICVSPRMLFLQTLSMAQHQQSPFQISTKGKD